MMHIQVVQQLVVVVVMVVILNQQLVVQQQFHVWNDSWFHFGTNHTSIHSFEFDNYNITYKDHHPFFVLITQSMQSRTILHQNNGINICIYGLDAIARLTMTDTYTNPENARRIETTQQKQMASIKSHQPEFFAGNSDWSSKTKKKKKKKKKKILAVNHILIQTEHNLVQKH